MHLQTHPNTREYIMSPLLYYSLLSLSFIFTLKLLLQRRKFKNLPPSPLITLPLIGNLHYINLPLHRSLHNLSQKYGNIFSLWFGSRRVVVISSQTLVQQCLAKYDVVLSNRPHFLTGKYLFYNYTSLDSAPYGDHCRNLRKIITLDILSRQRLNSFTKTRRKGMLKLIKNLARDSCDGFTRVELKTRLTDMVFDNMTKMVVGDAEEFKKFKEMVSEMKPLFGASNKGDFVPLLRLFDFDGIVKKMKDVGKRGDSFLQGIVEEIRSGKHNEDTMIQHLLTLQKSQPEYYSDEIIKGLIQVINNSIIHFLSSLFKKDYVCYLDLDSTLTYSPPILINTPFLRSFIQDTKVKIILVLFIKNIDQF